MALTELEIRSARATEKPIKLFDGDGLYLFVQPNGGRWWRFKYRSQGKERELSLGVYPEISLKLARTRREDARRAVAQGIDASAERKAAKESRRVTLELVADEWLTLQAKKLAPVTYDKARWMLSTFIYPRLGSRPIARRWAGYLFCGGRLVENGRRILPSTAMYRASHAAPRRVGDVGGLILERVRRPPLQR